MSAHGTLSHLDEAERECVLRYLSLLAQHLGGNLVQVWLCGSAARGDRWPDWMPIHSDIDLLVLTNESVPQGYQEQLIAKTYPFFLECGRQISPQFRTMEQFCAPQDVRTRGFVTRVRAEGYVICAAAQAECGGVAGEIHGMDT